MNRIIFTVTNDLVYDQRMHRICASLAQNGFVVTLTGRRLKNSLLPANLLFCQKRLYCFFSKGFMFYTEYNLRLFFYLLFQPFDAVCAIDLDTILPCYFVSFFRGKKRIYDAHELFTEQKEIVTRPHIHKFWLAVEKFAVPRFQPGYTVNQFIADELKRRYGVHYTVIRNLPELIIHPAVRVKNKDRFIIYQGAVNEGRSFETLIPAMKFVDAKLKIYGNGNFFEQVKELIKKHNVEDKVELKGAVVPDELKSITPAAYIAVMLFEQTGLNQYYSLSNRFFDYIMAGVPQVCINYPEYKTINDEFHIALMIEDTKIDSIASALNTLLHDDTLHKQLCADCVNAAKALNWQYEEGKLFKFYSELFF